LHSSFVGKLGPVLILFGATVISMNIGIAEPIAVRFVEGVQHSFLVLSSLDGTIIADGETTQTVRRGRVTAQLTFRFRDGSMYEDKVVFSQGTTFRLISDHLVEKGPAFPEPTDTLVNASTGQVTVRYKDKGGTEHVITKRMDLNVDLANGLVSTLLKNISPTLAETNVSMVVATPKPRVIGLEIRPEGEDSVAVGRLRASAIRYVVKVKLGGIAGAVAPILGKQPADTHVWILRGSVPAFLKSEGPLYDGGPIWRAEPVNPAIATTAGTHRH